MSSALQVGALPRIRKLRGSHLVFPGDRLPLTNAVTLFNPRDNRAMFALPWEGTVIFGTTDIDHQQILRTLCQQREIEYLLDAACLTFPSLELSEQDVISTFSGLRPIVSSGQVNNPSKESRAHVILQEDGLLTITGGKLTTYRIMAKQALDAVRTRFPQRPLFQAPAFDPLPDFAPPAGVDRDTLLYLSGRYGQHTPAC
jgi:glycerol-3-phosphate dehydrogenase